MQKARQTGSWAAQAALSFGGLEFGKLKLTSKVDAGWSSPVARQAHNLKVTGSNPVPATNLFICFDL